MVEQRSYLDRLRTRTAWLFLAPSLALLILVAGWPLARTVFFGFTDAYLGDLERLRFLTLKNYTAIFSEQPFGRNIVNSILVAGSVIVTLPLIVLVLACQRRIVSGLTAGAVKG
ncbi:MAG: hypothetical protein ACREUQ_09360 [Burkholderiales bacterium]